MMDDAVDKADHQPSLTLSQGRQRACLEAAWEIEALALLLPRLDLSEEPVAALQLRGVAAHTDVRDTSGHPVDGFPPLGC